MTAKYEINEDKEQFIVHHNGESWVYPLDLADELRIAHDTTWHRIANSLARMIDEDQKKGAP